MTELGLVALRARLAGVIAELRDVERGLECPYEAMEMRNALRQLDDGLCRLNSIEDPVSEPF